MIEMFASAMLAMMPVASSPEAEGVSSRRLVEWIDACERDLDCLHGFVFLRHGKVIAEGSWKPYDTLNETHFLSSHSKCFVSTAVGFLVEDGKLDLDERLVDVLSDLVPKNPSPNLQSIRIRDMLTMNFGATTERIWPDGNTDIDWPKAALARKVENRPGLAFRYDSFSTHLLGVVIARRAGKPFWDFLRERLFSKIGIDKAWTTYDPRGNPCVSWGMNMTTREISRIGQLYLDKGMWNGERILSEDWVDLATAKQTWSGKNQADRQEKNDWVLGFGFNWWRCQHGCYRADGAGGQFTIVMPKYDAVLSINADVEDMQKVLDVVWERFLPALKPSSLPEDADAARELRHRCESLELKPVAGRREGLDPAFCGKDFTFDPPAGKRIHGIRLDTAADGWTLRMKTDAGVFDVPVGFGKWALSGMRFSKNNYEVLGDMIGLRKVAASAAVQENGALKLRIHLLEGTHKIDMTFRRKMFKPVVEGHIEGLGKSGKFSSSWMK